MPRKRKEQTQLYARGPWATLNPTTSPTVAGLTVTGLTASELVATNGAKALASLAVATYPSLAELAYVKGVTSALQTQLDAKEPLITSAPLVANLPAAGALGRRRIVTDALAPSWNAAVVGGGAVVCKVWDNGTAWVCG